MISFRPTEDEQALLDTCARFAEQVLAPQTREADRENAIDDRVRQQYREMGMHLLGLPEAYGGSEFGLIAKVLAEEALARVDAAQAVALDEAGFAAQAVLLLGTDAQKQQWLAPFAQDAAYALALAADERDPAANLGYLQTRAEPAGEDYRLSGEKLAVYNAERARHFIVLARVQEGEGLAGVAAFVVDARDAGVTIELEDRMGLRAARACRVGFNEAKAQRLGGDSENLAGLQRLYAIIRTVNAARMVGAARGAHNFAIDYAQDRKTFGKPICAHQGLAFFMADMEVALEAARNLVIKAAWRLAQGEDATVESCNAAIYAAESGVRVTIDAIQVYGGAGFMKDMPVERYARDVRTLANMLGSSEDHLAVLGQALYANSGLTAKDSKAKAVAP